MGLYNDYTDVEHKVKKERVKHELFASIVIPFNKGHNTLARTIASLTKQTYSRDRFEVIIVADDNHIDARLIDEQFKRELDIKLITISNYGFGAASSRNTGARFSNTSNTPPLLRSFSSISRILYFIDDLEFLLVVYNLCTGILFSAIILLVELF